MPPEAREVRDDKTAIEQPLHRFVDFVGRELPLQPAKDVAKTLSRSDRGCQRAIKRAVKKELSVVGIEAYHVGRQHIDVEIRSEPRNVFAVMLRKGLAAGARRNFGADAFTLVATSVDHHCKKVFFCCERFYGTKCAVKRLSAPAFLDKAKCPLGVTRGITPRMPPRRQCE